MHRLIRGAVPLVGVLGFLGILVAVQVVEYPDHLSRTRRLSQIQSMGGSSTVSRIPLRIEIPILRVDAPIEPVGLTADGAMAMPISQSVVGWLVSDVLPGDQGVSVMAGHYGASDSIFNTLHRLAIGDRIVAFSGAGSESFLVTRLQGYTSTQRVPEVFTTGYQGSFLNLISCSGAWDSDAGEYESRLVVFTERET